MNPSPFLGVFLHAIGGFAAGSFYAPLKKVIPIMARITLSTLDRLGSASGTSSVAANRIVTSGTPRTNSMLITQNQRTTGRKPAGRRLVRKPTRRWQAH